MSKSQRLLNRQAAQTDVQMNMTLPRASPLKKVIIVRTESPGHLDSVPCPMPPPKFEVAAARRYGSALDIGLYATAPIPEGRIILSEKPMLSIPSTRTKASFDNILRAITTLPAIELRHLKNLSFRFLSALQTRSATVAAKIHLSTELKHFDLLARLGPEKQTEPFKNLVLGTCLEYSVPFVNDGSVELEEYRLCLERLCFVNHSCLPNAAMYWDQGTEEMVLRATSAIDEGDKVTVSYLPNPFLGKEERWRMLGFECKCDLCSHENEVAIGYHEEICKALTSMEKLRVSLLDPPLPDDLRMAERDRLCYLADAAGSNVVQSAAQNLRDFSRDSGTNHVSFAPVYELCSALSLASFLVLQEDEEREGYLRMAIEMKEKEIELIAFGLRIGDERIRRAVTELLCITDNAVDGRQVFLDRMKRIELDAEVKEVWVRRVPKKMG